MHASYTRAAVHRAAAGNFCSAWQCVAARRTFTKVQSPPPLSRLFLLHHFGAKPISSHVSFSSRQSCKDQPHQWREMRRAWARGRQKEHRVPGTPPFRGFPAAFLAFLLCRRSRASCLPVLALPLCFHGVHSARSLLAWRGQCGNTDKKEGAKERERKRESGKLELFSAPFSLSINLLSLFVPRDTLHRPEQHLNHPSESAPHRLGCEKRERGSGFP